MIPYGRQNITAGDVKAVSAVLGSDWITQGPAIEQFERAVADYCGAEYAVAVSNGTAALHLAALALDLGPGDQLWTSPITFLASANCALYCGAKVDFVDVDPATITMDPVALDQKLAEAANHNELPAIIIPVHFAGQSCNMETIKALADQYDVRVMEDACQALGGSYRMSKIGDCRHSDAAIFSFHPVKSITTGEGGMVVTNDKKMCERVKRLRSHGVTRSEELMQEKTHGPWYYEQVELGFNYRLTDIQAALGKSQLDRLDSFVSRRAELAARYSRAFSDLPVTPLTQAADQQSAWHLYVIQIDLASVSLSRREIFEALRIAGIGVNVHHIPVHLQPFYSAFGFAPGDFPHAENYYKRAITLPLYKDLTDAQQDEVIATVKATLS